MSNNNKSNNGMVVPEARAAMDKFKMEAANEVGVDLKQGYNGDLTSRQAGSIGGQMVKNIYPKRQLTISRTNRNVVGYKDFYNLTILTGIKQ